MQQSRIKPEKTHLSSADPYHPSFHTLLQDPVAFSDGSSQPWELAESLEHKDITQ
jgi:hypothetical protein